MAKYKKLLKGTHQVATQLIEHRVESSWVDTIGIASLANDRLVLTVRFKNGTHLGYTFTRDDTIMQFWNDWFAAASKGKFLWHWLYKNPYIYLS